METATITALYIYPIKSCHGIQVSSSALFKEGLAFDRRFMLVDSENNFLTIRQVSKLTLINIGLDVVDGKVHLTISSASDKLSSIRVPAQPRTSDHDRFGTSIEDVIIWGRKLRAHVFPLSITQHLSEFLSQDVRLAYHDPQLDVRLLTGNGSTEQTGITRSVGYADLHPLLLASTESLTELNSMLQDRSKDQISITRFRPNIVFSGRAPWDEDTWECISVAGQNSEGITVIDVLCRCARCQVPNVDESTGIKDTKEPWTTLMSFRRIDDGINFKPCFGVLCAPRYDGDPHTNSEDCAIGETTICVGDVIRIDSRTSNHRYIPGF